MKIRFMIDYLNAQLEIVTVEVPSTTLKLEQSEFERFRQRTKESLQVLYDPIGGTVQTEQEWTMVNCGDEHYSDQEEYEPEVGDE